MLSFYIYFYIFIYLFCPRPVVGNRWCTPLFLRLPYADSRLQMHMACGMTFMVDMGDVGDQMRWLKVTWP